MKDLIRDTRVQRLLLANITGSIGSGITIVAIPWLLVHRTGGDQVYGYATIGTTIVLFLFMPHYGSWIDRHSRKTMLLAGELFGLVATVSMAAVAFVSGHVDTWQLIASYFCGIMGRIGMFYGAADRLLRTALISISTLIVAHHSPTMAFAVLWLILVAAIAGALATRSSLPGLTREGAG